MPVPKAGSPIAEPRKRRRGIATGPSPVDRRKSGSNHHLICDGKGTPLTVVTTAANVNDVTQALVPVGAAPPVADRVGHPRKRPDALLGDKGYDSAAVRRELRHRGVLPVISRRGHPTSTTWASSATSSSRPSPSCTSSNDSPSAGNAESTSTTPSSHSAAH